MADTGPLSASIAETESGNATAQWTIDNGTELQAIDAAYAYAVVSALATNSYLIARGFNAAVPAGATITGFEARIVRRSSAITKNPRDRDVKLYSAGATVGSNKAAVTVYPASDTLAVYGGDGDLWGLTAPTPETVNDPSFGVTVAAQRDAGAGNPQVYVDSLVLIIYYTAAVASRPQKLTTFGLRAARLDRDGGLGSSRGSIR